jgi:predicted DCC family thiol-disulfide oxidoreductase YuxK
VPRDTCYYDGQCGLCRRTTRLLRAVDLFHRLDFQDMTAVPESSLPFPLTEAMTGMPMRTRRGRALLGFSAVRRALAQTILAPLAWLMYVPGLSRISAATYRRIAAGRARDGGAGACALPPSVPPRILRP